MLVTQFVSDSLRPHEPQHTRPPCPSPTPGVHSNPWHCAGDAIQPSHPPSSLLLLPSIFPNIRVFSNESALCIRWPMYWSFNFNISPSSEHPGQISFTIDWLDILASKDIQGTWYPWYQESPRDSQESSPTPQFKSINYSALSFLYSPTLTSIHDHWKSHSLD